MQKEWTNIVLELAPPCDGLPKLDENCTTERREEEPRPAPWETPASSEITGVVIGVLLALKRSGQPLVAFQGNPTSHALPARSTIVLSEADMGRQVALMFEAGDPGKPIVIGRIENLGIAPQKAAGSTLSGASPIVDLDIDGERVTLAAHHELLLRCGKASILLRSDGKIIIKGTELLSRASGLNKIKGAAVHIN
jgi:hypothetical protein